MSHIYAAKDKGPRGNPDLTEKQRKQPENLILLCPTHHAVVDTQYATYPASLLIEWKQRHERRYREKIHASLRELGYAELEVAARALISVNTEPSCELGNIPPQEKLKKNSLGQTSEMMLRMGGAKSKEVENLLRHTTQLDPQFADRLRNGFVAKYGEFKSNGLEGDDLFMAMYDWTTGETQDVIRASAGLCILSHLFIICDVFEK